MFGVRKPEADSRAGQAVQLEIELNGGVSPHQIGQVQSVAIPGAFCRVVVGVHQAVAWDWAEVLEVEPFGVFPEKRVSWGYLVKVYCTTWFPSKE